MNLWQLVARKWITTSLFSETPSIRQKKNGPSNTHTHVSNNTLYSSLRLQIYILCTRLCTLVYTCEDHRGKRAVLRFYEGAERRRPVRVHDNL